MDKANIKIRIITSTKQKQYQRKLKRSYLIKIFSTEKSGNQKEKDFQTDHNRY